MDPSMSRRQDRRHMSQHHLPALRTGTDQNQLPPLSEVLPELRQTRPASDHLSHYPRTLHESSRGPSQFPEARSLAPSPLAARSHLSRSVEYSQVAQPQSSYGTYYGREGRAETQLSRPSAESSGSSWSSDVSERRRSLNSSSTSITRATTRGSPALPSMHSVHAPPRAELGGRVGREDYALPSINRDSGSAPLNSYSREPPSRLEDYSGPAQSYSGVGSAYQASSPVQTPYQHYGVAQSGAYSYPSGQHATRSPYEEGNDSAQYPLNFEAVGDFGEATHRRRPGRNLPKHVTDILRTWFSDHIAHPYPTEDEKQMLMGRTGLTISQISNWFINARRRSLPQMTKQAQAEAELRDSQGRHPR